MLPPMEKLTYSNYLKIDELLNLQQIKSDDEHDETLFIIIHQVYELWFKQIIHEIGLVKSCFLNDDGHKVFTSLKRIITILKTLVAQMDVLETMTPLSFSAFRARLESSSGFQSYQFRMFEFTLGFKNEKMIQMFKDQPDVMETLMGLYNAPTLYDYFMKFIDGKEAYSIPKDVMERDFTQNGN